jgi:N-acetylglutamate synthase-like GNAT family acetyltransferase
MAKPKSSGSRKARLTIRNARVRDIPAIQALVAKVYTDIPGYTRAMLRGQLNQFQDGVFLAEFEGTVVGYCATFRIGDLALKPHTWSEITGNGYAARHDPDGEFLYGMEVCVDPDMRGWRIGQRLYDARKQLCEQLGLALRRGGEDQAGT